MGARGERRVIPCASERKMQGLIRWECHGHLGGSKGLDDPSEDMSLYHLYVFSQAK